jgi:hypothetical protein
MAKFLKCTHKDGRMLTELSLMDAKSARTISVKDTLHSLEQQLVGR